MSGESGPDIVQDLIPFHTCFEHNVRLSVSSLRGNTLFGLSEEGWRLLIMHEAWRGLHRDHLAGS